MFFQWKRLLVKMKISDSSILHFVKTMEKRLRYPTCKCKLQVIYSYDFLFIFYFDYDYEKNINVYIEFPNGPVFRYGNFFNPRDEEISIPENHGPFGNCIPVWIYICANWASHIVLTFFFKKIMKLSQFAINFMISGVFFKKLVKLKHKIAWLTLTGI